MNLFQELRERRVPQIASGYVVGAWGLLQFLAFLESRMRISPHLVNLAGLTLLLLLPAMTILAWVQGRPGKDTWGRKPKAAVIVNVLIVVILVGFLYGGRDLGAVTRTIAVEDEHGAVSERIVPKNEYRRRLLIFYPENGGDAEDDWARETLAFLLSLDVGQDGFVDTVTPYKIIGALQEAGSDDGHGLSRPLQRKLARDAHLGHFLTATVARAGAGWQLDSELHESESGRVVAKRSSSAADLFALTDRVSRQLREDLGIPAAHLEKSPDLPIAELTSADIQAVADDVGALSAISHHNDWEGALPQLESAVERDPQFALAQFLLFAVRSTLGDAEGASKAIGAAMENLYRLPERFGFIIKAQYYFNEEQDVDKAMAVVRMWSQIYPNDVGAYEQLALFYFIRQDLPNAIAAYESILAIDPSRVSYLDNLATLHTQLGDLEEAEDCLQRYVSAFPTRADGYENLSDFYSATGRLDAARAALEKAQLLEPENVDLALSRIDLDAKDGAYEAAEAALAALLTHAKAPRDSFRIHSRRLTLALKRGRADLLAERLEAFHASGLRFQNPMQANMIQSLKLPQLAMAGRPEDALARLAAVRDRIPAPYDDLVGLGEAWVLAQEGRLDEARARLAEAEAVVAAFKFETYRPTLTLVEGMIDEAAGDLDAAIANYRIAAADAIQRNPIYKQRLARALRLAGHDREARAVLEEAMAVEPEHPPYHLELAHLQHARGRDAEARKHLDVALEAWKGALPEFAPAAEARRLAAELAGP